MTKNEFRAIAAHAGVQCNYSGHTKTMYISGDKPGMDYILAIFKDNQSHFKVARKDI